VTPDKDKSEGKEETAKYQLSLHWSDEANKLPIREARDLYFKEYPYERIYLKTGVPPSVFLLKRKQWDKVKARVDERIITNIRKKALSESTKLFVEKGLAIGLKLVDRLMKREDEITIKDWKLLSDSIMALHRVHQLELGKPTDIKAYENMSPEQVKGYILEIQKQLGAKHEMSMFAGDDVPEDEILKEYLSGNNSRIN
jgi:hypothetical protein